MCRRVITEAIKARKEAAPDSAVLGFTGPFPTFGVFWFLSNQLKEAPPTHRGQVGVPIRSQGGATSHLPHCETRVTSRGRCEIKPSGERGWPSHSISATGVRSLSQRRRDQKGAGVNFTFIGVHPRSICRKDANAKKSFVSGESAQRNLELPTQNRSGETIDGRAVPETSHGPIKAHERNRAAMDGCPPPIHRPHMISWIMENQSPGKQLGLREGLRNPPAPQRVLMITPNPGPFKSLSGAGRGGGMGGGAASCLTYCSCQREAGVRGRLT